MFEERNRVDNRMRDNVKPYKKIEAQVILSKCEKTADTFGINMEKRGDDWVRTWAFPIKDDVAKREGFDKNMLSGSFSADPEYPGCPYCEAVGFFICECGKMSCWDINKGNLVTCYWCGLKTTIEIRESFKVKGGAY